MEKDKESPFISSFALALAPAPSQLFLKSWMEKKRKHRLTCSLLFLSVFFYSLSVHQWDACMHVCGGVLREVSE